MLNNPFSDENFPNIQSKPPQAMSWLTQLNGQAIDSPIIVLIILFHFYYVLHHIRIWHCFGYVNSSRKFCHLTFHSSPDHLSILESTSSQAQDRCLHRENKQATPAPCFAPWWIALPQQSQPSHPMATELFWKPSVKSASKEGRTNQAHWLNIPTLQWFLRIYQTLLKPATHC